MGMSRTIFGIALGLLLIAPLAAAQPLHQQLNTSTRSPWSQGVSQEDQGAAAALFQEGNGYYEQGLFLKAADLYRRSLKRWDHPAIHYNLSLALMDSGLKLELREHLEAAMRYGEAPLDKKMLEHASKLRAFIEKQLVRVDVSCDVPGASVMMDGRVLFTGPDHFKGWVLPGSHVFVVVKEGYPPNERIRTPREGEEIRLHISNLYDDSALTRYRRKWPTWKPWAAFSAGAGLVAGGAAMTLLGRRDIHAFDTRAKECGSGGCTGTPTFAKLSSRGERLQKVGIVISGAGGALAVAGGVFAFINRAQPYRLTPDECDQESRVAIHLGRGTTELVMSIQF
ncbi:tetratricopeptide repeat protein [Hyalangium gracile]|uniref:tetratricopeptide repeat protein n=1 Tax=Hyalangium gracile TaxID=394092 RepID=UPI001CCF9792|nr:tetratricopeptide repeat protein [Hyalangium gracile]